MKTTIAHNNIIFTASANRGKEVYYWGLNRYKFNITISANGSKKYFSYFGSNFDWSNRKNKLQENEVKEAVYMIFSDALCYFDYPDIFDFGQELGYKNINEWLKCYRGCQSTAKRLQKLGFTKNDIIEIANKLNEE